MWLIIIDCSCLSIYYSMDVCIRQGNSLALEFTGYDAAGCVTDFCVKVTSFEKGLSMSLRISEHATSIYVNFSERLNCI